MPKYTEEVSKSFAPSANIKKEKSLSADSTVFCEPSGRKSSLDTLEVEGCKHSYLAEVRKLNREVAKVLLAKHLQNQIEDDPLFKAQRNIMRCSMQGAFLSLSDTVNYKIGQALCKSRLCPNCQRVLSAKRKYNFLSWFDLNRDQLQQYGFYHMALTMRHKKEDNIRTDVYTEELLQNYKKLRGGLGYRDNKIYWDKRVAGGIYSVETTAAHDGTLHIHLHILLFGKMPLWRKVRRVDALSKNAKKKGKKMKAESDKSEFEKEISARWLAITGDSHCGVFIEPVYKLDAEKNKQYYTKGQEGIEDAVSECIKYTMKSDPDSISKFSVEHLRGLLRLKKRYSGRFGCLTVKSKESKRFKKMDMLNNDYLDLESISREEIRKLFNPETGEIVDKKDTRIAVTWFSNTIPVESEIEMHNRFSKDQVKSIIKIDRGTNQNTFFEDSERKNEKVHYNKGEVPYGGDTYYNIKKLDKVVWFETWEKQEVAKRLAGSMYARYDAANDLPNPENILNVSTKS